jgi:hypothetical protein
MQTKMYLPLPGDFLWGSWWNIMYRKVEIAHNKLVKCTNTKQRQYEGKFMNSYHRYQTKRVDSYQLYGSVRRVQ